MGLVTMTGMMPSYSPLSHEFLLALDAEGARFSEIGCLDATDYIPIGSSIDWDWYVHREERARRDGEDAAKAAHQANVQKYIDAIPDSEWPEILGPRNG